MEKTSVADKSKYNIKVVERTLQILDLAGSVDGPISVQNVCAALGVNTNMAFRLLKSIEEGGYLAMDPKSGLYNLTLRSLRLSRTALHSFSLLKVVRPYLEMLWNRYPKANFNLAVREGMHIMMIFRIDGETKPRTYFEPGICVPFYCTGTGKVLSSSLPPEEVDAMIKAAGGLKPLTSHTITDRSRLLDELAKTREEGVGRDREEYIPGDNCTAVPLVDGERKVVAAISASCLTSSMSADEVEALADPLRATAARINSTIGNVAV